MRALLLCSFVFAGCARGIEMRDGGRADAASLDGAGTEGGSTACMATEERPCYTGPTATRGRGACADGVQRCESGAFGECTGQTLPAAREDCGNGVDDDCDGTVDNGCGECRPGDTRSCYSGPDGTMGVGTCRGGMQSCTTESTWGSCLGEVTPAGSENCTNTEDDDCNGEVNDRCGECMPGEVRACYSGPAATRGRGRCVAGTQVCTPMRVWSTTCMGEVTPAPMELCINSIDDDCNGMSDEGCGECMPDSTQPCYTGPMSTMGVGACRSGTQRCTSLRMWPTTCTGEVRPAASETCGNMIDDNCNGTTDEGCPTCSPPVNQTCATSSSLTIGGSITGTTACARSMYTASCGASAAGPELAYRVVIPADTSPTQYRFRMAIGTLSDPVLHLHAANPCSTSNELACNDDVAAGIRDAELAGGLAAGTYYVIADSYSTATQGTFTLTTTRDGINNDACDSPLRILSNGAYRGTTAGKANNYSPTSSTSCSSNSAPDVVYTIIPTRSGRITLDTVGSSFDTVLYVASGAASNCGRSTTACNDDNSSSVQSTVAFDATAGTTYYVVVDGYGTTSGTYVLNVSGL